MLSPNEPCIQFINMCKAQILALVGNKFLVHFWWLTVTNINLFHLVWLLKFTFFSVRLETGSMLTINIAQQACICQCRSDHISIFKGTYTHTHTHVKLACKDWDYRSEYVNMNKIEMSILYASLELSRCNKLSFINQNKKCWFYFQ